MADELAENVRGAIRSVRSGKGLPISTFWHSDYINIGFGIDDQSDDERGLSVQVEIIAPDRIMDVEELEPGETPLSEVSTELSSLESSLIAAAEVEVGRQLDARLVYLGEPMTKPGVDSVLFDATLIEAK